MEVVTYRGINALQKASLGAGTSKVMNSGALVKKGMRLVDPKYIVSSIPRSSDNLSARHECLHPSSYHSGLPHIREMMMVGENHLLVVGILFHVDVILNVIEGDLDEAVIVGITGFGEIAKDLSHHLLRLAGIMLLS